MVKYLIFVLAVVSTVVVLSSCGKSTKYELTIDREPYFGDELKMNGYYYYQYSENKDHTAVLFFYRNGVVFDGKAFTTGNLETIDKYFIDNKHLTYKDESRSWSLFKVKKDSLVFETWNPPTLTKEPEPIIHYCEILNDTTFKVYKTKLYSQTEIDEVSFTYHYRQFDHKPDSTNNFIR